MFRSMDETSGGSLRPLPLDNGAHMANSNLGLAFAALAIYVIGGVVTFAGIGLLFFMGERDLWGWGSGHGLGYFFICIGLVLTIAGVLVMRIIRNRDPG